MVFYIPVVRWSENKGDVFFGKPCYTMAEAVKCFKNLVLNRHYEPNRSYIVIAESKEFISSKDVLLPIYKAQFKDEDGEPADAN